MKIYNEKNKTTSNMKNKKKLHRCIKFVIINIIVSASISIIFIAIINKSIANNNTSLTNSNHQPYGEYKQIVVKSIPADATCINYSSDNKYHSYLQKGEIYIFENSDDKTVYKIKEPYKILQSIVLHESDLILYAYIDDNNLLHMKTCNIASKNTLSYSPMYVIKGAKIKSISYAINTNIIFINTETSRDGITTDILYRMDIMNNVTVVPLGVIATNIEPSYKDLNMYFEDNKNNLHYMQYEEKKGKKTFNYYLSTAVKGKKIQLIGCDKFNNYYVIDKNSDSKISVINNDKIIKTYKIPSGFTGFYKTEDKIYAIYNNGIEDIMDNKGGIIKFDSKYKFLGIIDKNIYLQEK